MKLKLLLLSVLMGLSISSRGQDSCGTPVNSTPQHFKEDDNGPNAKTTPEGLCINVYFHIVRRSNGTGGFNPANINAIVQNLNEVFNPHRIYINNLGTGFINNSGYYNLAANAFNGLISMNNVSNAINFYLVNSAPYTGRAEDILSKNLVVVNSSALSPTSPHELGHCLNLWHTHHGRGCDDTGGCAENINGSNCSTCGDFVCDTPADPCVRKLVDANCQYTGGGGFNPDVTNIMSYGGQCSTNFSNGQGIRMRAALYKSSLLQPVLSNNCVIPDLSGPSTLCYSANGTTYSLQNGGSSVSWNVSSNLQILSSSNTGITVRPNNSSTKGAGFVEAVLPLETIREEFWTGVPNASNIIIWNSTETESPRNTTPTNTPVEFVAGYPPNDRCDILEAEWRPISGVYFMNGSFPCDIDNGTNKLVVFQQPGTYYMQARIRNTCGWSGWSYPVSMQVTQGGYGYSMYPNPADETLTIEKIRKDGSQITSQAKTEETIYHYELYDFSGNLKLRGKLADKAVVDVSRLTAGRYILKVLTGSKQVEVQHIVIN